MIYLRSSLAVLALALLASTAAFAAESGTTEATSTRVETAISPVPCEFPEGPAFGEDGLSALCAGCTIALDTSGVGATCSCSAAGQGATCTRQTNQGGNTQTVTCQDATSTVVCSYTRNGNACNCA